MDILVLGAGTVGASISEMLCQYGHDVTVVDNDVVTIEKIRNDLDVRAICGSASQSSILFQAGVSTADICLAVTGIDEVNMVAASLARSMGARRAIARVYASVFRDLSTFDYQSHFGIDRMLSLEHLSAMELARNIRSPGSVVVDHFARGELEVREVIVSQRSQTVGVNVKDLGLPKSVRIGSIMRDDRMWVITAADTLQAGDQLSLIGFPSDLEQVTSRFQTDHVRYQRVVIAGGGETGFHLARTLENERFSVLLIESNLERCEQIAALLAKTTVVHADMTQKQVMEEERIGMADHFVVCTGDDENNIVAGVEAREAGAKNILAIVGRPDYAHIVAKLGIDVAVSERNVMATRVLGFLNPGRLVSKTRLPGGNVGVYEIEVDGDSAIIQARLADLQLPEGCLLAAIMRKEYVCVPSAHDQLQAGDSVVVFMDQSLEAHVLAMFESSVAVG